MKFINYFLRLSIIFLSLIYRRKFFKKAIELNYSNRTCSILGNGPSLIDQLVAGDFLYKQENLFVVNNFVLTDYYKQLKPKYYVFADPCYWDVNSDQVEYLKSQSVLKKISNETDWELTIIAPIAAETAFKDHFKTNSKIMFYFFKAKTLSPVFPKISHYLYSKNFICPEYQNVLVIASFLAINMGFKEINLFGAEHSWTELIRVNTKNQVCFTDKHFYDLEAKLKPWINVNGNIYRMSEILIDLSKMFQGYYYIYDYAKYKGATVYNCTPNSYIDAFERKEI